MLRRRQLLISTTSYAILAGLGACASNAPCERITDEYQKASCRLDDIRGNIFRDVTLGAVAGSIIVGGLAVAIGLSPVAAVIIGGILGGAATAAARYVEYLLAQEDQVEALRVMNSNIADDANHLRKERDALLKEKHRLARIQAEMDRKLKQVEDKAKKRDLSLRKALAEKRKIDSEKEDLFLLNQPSIEKLRKTVKAYRITVGAYKQSMPLLGATNPNEPNADVQTSFRNKKKIVKEFSSFEAEWVSLFESYERRDFS